MRKIPSLVFAGLLSLSAALATAAEPENKTVAAMHQDKAALSGQVVRVQGKVVKVNNGIMGRNFVHVQDGSGEAATGTNNLIITSKQTARVGDSVAVTGRVMLNRDFGSGYSYPLLIEDSSIAPAN